MLTSITAIYAYIMGLVLVALAYRVVMLRQKYSVGLGAGGHQDLEHAIRVEGNFIEYVPFALILMLLFEMNGAEPWLVHVIGATLVGARLWHAWSFGRNPGVSNGRIYGTMITWMVIVALCVGNLYYVIFPATQ